MYFKNILHIVFFSLLSLVAFASGDAHEATFQEGNLAYESGNFEKAIESYEILTQIGFGSENTSFNLANAYFKTKQIGKSILYYEKVLKQNPKNEDAIKNLAFVKTKLEHNLNELPDLFFVTWWKNLVYLFKADTWAWIAIFFAWSALAALAFYFFSKNSWFKKAAFSKVIIFTVFALFSFLIMKINNGSIANKTEMILVSKQSQAKDAPSQKAQDLDLFYEGSKLEVLDSLEGFYKTKNADKQVVWVSKSDFEII